MLKGLYHLNEHTVFTPDGEKAVHLHRLNEQTLFTPAGKNGLVRSTLLIPPSVWLSKQDTCFSSRLFLKETRPSKKAGVVLFYGIFYKYSRTVCTAPNQSVCIIFFPYPS